MKNKYMRNRAVALLVALLGIVAWLYGDGQTLLFLLIIAVASLEGEKQ